MDPLKINKLILFVTESCNLRCHYCYEMLPGVCRKAAAMPEETAGRIAQKVFSKDGSCSFVQFFGGEPTLNMGAIRVFVAEVLRLADEGKINRLPRFGIVTNGAARKARKYVPFFRDHDIGVTVSLDGPRAIHDALRPDAGGGGSFDGAMSTIEALRNAGAPVVIETVYTTLHIDLKCTIVDLLEFARGLGATKIVFHTAYPPAPPSLCPFDDAHFDRLLKNHVEAVRWWFDTLVNERTPVIDIYFKDLLRPLLQGVGAAVGAGGCPAGTSDYSISPDGSVYACHLLYGMPAFRLGNILTDEALADERTLPRSVRDFLRCAECFARHWCQPCGALNIGWGDAWIPPERECQLRRTVLRTIGELAFAQLSIPDNPLTAVLRNAVNTS
jgi:uncharacterized protein